MALTDAEMVQRAEHAARLLEDTMLQEALAAIEMNITLKWARTQQGQVTEREFCYTQLQTVALFRGYLKARLTDGKMVVKAQADGEANGGRATSGP